MKIIIFFISTSLFAAVSLHNNDSKSYNLYIDHGSSATNTSISSNTTTSICSKSCKIKIKDTNSIIEAKDGDKIEIKNGKLSKK